MVSGWGNIWNDQYPFVSCKSSNGSEKTKIVFVSSVALGIINTSQDHNKEKWAQSELVQVSIFWKNYLKFPINLFK